MTTVYVALLNHEPGAGGRAWLTWWCAGCESRHRVPVEGGAEAWTFTGGLEAPTLSPSVRTRPVSKDGTGVCHIWLRAGVVTFLGDCTHALAGQTVPLRDVESWPW